MYGFRILTFALDHDSFSRENIILIFQKKGMLIDDLRCFLCESRQHPPLNLNLIEVNPEI